jgi:glycine cleavage system H protein
MAKGDPGSLGRRYTKNGEWLAFDGRVWRAGLAASAAADLGDVTFVEPPATGTAVAAGDPVCALEAVKAAADFYAPVSGVIAGSNPRLSAEPELVSTSPEADGWIVALEGVDTDAVAALMDQAAWDDWESGR